MDTKDSIIKGINELPSTPEGYEALLEIKDAVKSRKLNMVNEAWENKYKEMAGEYYLSLGTVFNEISYYNEAEIELSEGRLSKKLRNCIFNINSSNIEELIKTCRTLGLKFPKSVADMVCKCCCSHEHEYEYKEWCILCRDKKYKHFCCKG